MMALVRLKVVTWEDVVPFLGLFAWIPFCLLYILPKLNFENPFKKHSSRLKQLYITNAENLLKTGLAKVNEIIP